MDGLWCLEQSSNGTQEKIFQSGFHLANNNVRITQQMPLIHLPEVDRCLSKESETLEHDQNKKDCSVFF